MNRSEIIANRLEEVLLNGDWIARTNIKKLIENLSWMQAVQKVNALNTIAELVFHLDYFLGGINNVFEGGKLEIRDKFSFDMPPINSESEWRILVDRYLSNAQIFIDHVRKFEDSKFDAPFVMEQYGTYLRNIEGVIEHSYYHMGQISLLVKMIG